MSLDVVVGWQGSIFNDNILIKQLDCFCANVLNKLNIFYLFNEKEKGFDYCFEEAKKMMGSVFPKTLSFDMNWYNSLTVMTRIYEHFTEKGETLEDMKKRLISEIEKVQRAENVAEVRDSIQYLRRKFGELSKRCFKETYHPEWG